MIEENTLADRKPLLNYHASVFLSAPLPARPAQLSQVTLA